MSDEEKKEEVAAGPKWEDPAKALGLATLICIDSGIEINEEHLAKLLEAAGCKVEDKYSKVFEEAVQKGMDLKDLVDEFGKGGGGGGAAPAGGATETAGGAAAEAPAEEEEESEQESSVAAGGMFGDDSSSDDSSS